MAKTAKTHGRYKNCKNMEGNVPSWELLEHLYGSICDVVGQNPGVYADDRAPLYMALRSSAFKDIFDKEGRRLSVGHNARNAFIDKVFDMDVSWFWMIQISKVFVFNWEIYRIPDNFLQALRVMYHEYYKDHPLSCLV